MPAAEPTSPRRAIYHHRTRGDGAEGIHIREMGDALEELGFQVEYCCPKQADRQPGLSLGMTGISAADSAGFAGKLRHLVRQSGELAYNVVSFVRLWRALGKHQPEFVYERYSCYHFGGVAAAKARRVPLLLEVNCTYAGDFPRRVLTYPRIGRWIENYALRNSSGVAVVSEPLRRCVQKRPHPQTRITVTPNAVNEHSVQDYLAHRIGNMKRKELGLDGRIVIGFVGSLRRWHGVDRMIQLIPTILKQVPNASFLIVGSGELEDSVRKLHDDPEISDRVILTGGVPHAEVMGLVDALDIGLMPQSNEWGSPMKILEYMSLGKLTVAPKLEPIEALIEHGKTGLLFDSTRDEAFLDAILLACNDESLRRRIGSAAQDKVLTSHRWTDNAKHCLALLEVSTDA
tara:strand:+ start:68661 stop:69866 length:1206 start_codon:yes stop_codon:yes gene_type:complete